MPMGYINTLNDEARLADLPVVNGKVDVQSLSVEQCHQLIHELVGHVASLEPSEPTEGVLQRSVLLEETSRKLEPLKHHYAGLLQDAFNTYDLRGALGLPKGKTPFRDAADLLAKTHGIRAYEAAGRLKIAAQLTPVRSTDTSREDQLEVGDTKYPLLGELQAQGNVHPTKFATALNMLESVDEHAQQAGKDEKFREKLRAVIEQDLVEKIEHTTPEEFSRYASRRKTDLIAAMDPPDKQFTTAQTQAMHTMRYEGTVRGNPDAHRWSVITSAEGHEIFKTLEAVANNPRTHQKMQDAENTASSKFDSRNRGQRTMHALLDALRFAIGRIEHTDMPGTGGNHTQVMVVVDYPSLIQYLHTSLEHLLPELEAQRRNKLLGLLAEQHHHTGTYKKPPDNSMPHPKRFSEPGKQPAKTVDLTEIVRDQNLERLQPRIGQGMYTSWLPPEVILRLLCEVRISPVTLTGEGEILAVGRRQREFPETLRRAIMVRDRGCAVPGCHWPAAWCEIHHIDPWSEGGTTDINNGVTLCAHHHQAAHANMLTIVRDDGVIRFIQHPLIDPTQQPRQNVFWKT